MPAGGETAPVNTVAEAVFKQAGMYHNAGEFDKAVEAYTRAIALDPANFDAYFNRGNIYYLQQKNYDAAMADWKKVVSLAPGFPDAYGMLGWLLIETGKHEEAREYCREAWELSLDNMGWTVNFGHTYLLQGDFEKAGEYYSKALPLIASDEELTKGPVRGGRLMRARSGLHGSVTVLSNLRRLGSSMVKLPHFLEKAIMKPLSRLHGGYWRYGINCLVKSIPMLPPHSTTLPLCTVSRAGTRRRSRTTSGRWR